MNKGSLSAVCLYFAVLLHAKGSVATTVIPPTFDELVREAEVIVLGSVVASQPLWSRIGTADLIITRVRIRVERSVKGGQVPELGLAFLGGQVGDTALHVSDVPHLAVGERAVFFISTNGNPISPIVRFRYGLFHVARQVDGRDIVLTLDGSPLVSVNDIGSPAPVRVGTPMELAQFIAEIQRAVLRLAAQPGR